MLLTCHRKRALLFPCVMQHLRRTSENCFILLDGPFHLHFPMVMIGFSFVCSFVRLSTARLLPRSDLVLLEVNAPGSILLVCAPDYESTNTPSMPTVSHVLTRARLLLAVYYELRATVTHKSTHSPEQQTNL